MRIIETEAYTFDELSDDAKEKVIEKFREQRYDEDISDWIIDDCYLLNPKGVHDLIIGNTRKVYYDIYSGYINISKGMDIKDDKAFLNWLNIPIELHNEVYYTIKKDTIYFEENDCEYEFTENENKILDDVLTQLYLMRTAVGQESTPKLLQRINKIRKELLKLKESNI